MKRIYIIGLLWLSMGVDCFSNGAQKIDTIEVAVYKTVHLIFSDSILRDNIDVGSKMIDHKMHNNNELLLYAKESDFLSTNISIQTYRNGELRYYMFILVYNEHPLKLFHVIDQDQAIHVDTKAKLANSPVGSQKSNATTTETKQKGNKYASKSSDFDFWSKKAMAEIRTHSRGAIKYRMTMIVDGIFVHEDYLYLRVRLGNDGSINYNIDYVGLEIKSKKKAKRTVSDSNELPILYPGTDKLESIVMAQSTYEKVIVIEKVTFERGEKLVLEFRESKGDRNISVDIWSTDILTAKML